MAQPSFVPISEADQVRPALHMHVPGVWTTDRPAEVVVPEHERGRTLGTPGPDSGFAMRLANRFGEELKLGEGETEHDVLLGVALIASKRAALYGRGPSVYDVRFGLNLWGFLDDAPAALRAERRAAFSSISHDYVAQRALADSVGDDTLRLSPDEARFKGGSATA
jgi:hypothetical protein